MPKSAAAKKNTAADLLFGWLWLAPVHYDKSLEDPASAPYKPASFGQGEREDWDGLVTQLRETSVRAAALAAYIETRKGLGNASPQPHEKGVKAFNRIQTRVRRALGFTYPTAAEIVF